MKAGSKNRDIKKPDSSTKREKERSKTEHEVAGYIEIRPFFSYRAMKSVNNNRERENFPRHLLLYKRKRCKTEH